MGFGRIVHTRIDCEADSRSRCQALKDILIELEERIDHLVNEEGVFAGNLPTDVKIMTEDGDKKPSDLLKGMSSVDEDASLTFVASQDDAWVSAGVSGVLESGRAYTCAAATPDGKFYMGLRNKPSDTEGLLEVYEIVDTVGARIATAESDTYRTPQALGFAMHPTGRYVASINTDAGDSLDKLVITDLEDPTDPVIVGTLVLAAKPASGTQAVWDAARGVIYWPGDSTNHVYVFDVSDPGNPTLASTYTTSGLTTPIAAALSPDREFLYLAGNGGVESASIAADGTLTKDTTIAVAQTYQTLDHNGTTLATLVWQSNTVIDVLTIDIDADDQGAISTNTNNSVTGSYAEAGDMRNCSYVGNYLACPSGMEGVLSTEGLFLVFDLRNLDSVTEFSSTVPSTLDANSVVAVGGPKNRKYVQLGLDAKVQTWKVAQRSGGVDLELQRICVRELCVESSELVRNLNAEFLNGLPGTAYLQVGDGVEGPASSTDDGIVTWDGTTGSVVQDSGVVLAELLRADGTVPLTANWDAGSFQIRAETFQSDVATGTAPLTVASTTVVANLNASLLGGQAGAFYLDSDNFTGTEWTDLTDAGATTLHKHDHGSLDGLTDNDHTQYPLISGTPADRQVAIFEGAQLIGGTSGFTANPATGSLVFAADATVNVTILGYNDGNDAVALTLQNRTTGGNDRSLMSRLFSTHSSVPDQLNFDHRVAGSLKARWSIDNAGNIIFLPGVAVVLYAEQATKHVKLAGAVSPGSGTNGLIMAQGTALGSMAPNTGAVQVKDVAGTAEVFAVDEGATATQLSSHNFTLFEPDPAEPFPASFYAESPVTGHRVAIDTMRLARLVEAANPGVQLVYYEQMPVEDLADWHADQRRNAERAMAEYERHEARAAEHASVEADHADAVTAWEALPSADDPRRAEWEALPTDRNGKRYRLARAVDDSGEPVRVRVAAPEPPLRELRRESVEMIADDGTRVRVPHLRERPPAPEPLQETPPPLPVVKEPPDMILRQLIDMGRWDQAAHDLLVDEVESWKATR